MKQDKNEYINISKGINIDLNIANRNDQNNLLKK
jgi:hypothetical protein